MKNIRLAGFRNLSLQITKGRLVWKSETLPDCELLRAPVIVGAYAGARGIVRGGLNASTSYQHGRSAFLGTHSDAGGDEMDVFAKGLGWTNGLAAGWSGELGNLGIFPLASAKHERDAACALHKIGLRTITPLAIWEYEELLDPYGPAPIQASAVIGLDGKPARPALFVYSCSFPYRVCDLSLMNDTERRETLGQAFAATRSSTASDYLFAMATLLGTDLGRLHSAGGHNYAASPHNLFLDGTQVDFEYCFLPGLPTSEAALNERPASWQDKEFLGWYDTLRALAWMVESEVSWPQLAGCLFDSYLSSGGNPHLDMARYASRVLRSFPPARSPATESQRRSS